MKTRLVLADPQKSVRQMAARFLTAECGCEVVAEAADGRAALAQCQARRPELLVLELSLGELCGVEVLRRLRAEAPGVRALVYTGVWEFDALVRALQGQPHGFVHKSDDVETLRDAVRTVAKGGTFLTPFGTVLQREARVGACCALSDREREVLQMVAESWSSKQIAKRLGLSVKTVENHRARVMEKLHLHDVAALTRYAWRHGMVSEEKAKG